MFESQTDHQSDSRHVKLGIFQKSIPRVGYFIFASSYITWFMRLLCNSNFFLIKDSVWVPCHMENDELMDTKDIPFDERLRLLIFSQFRDTEFSLVNFVFSSQNSV